MTRKTKDSKRTLALLDFRKQKLQTAYSGHTDPVPWMLTSLLRENQ